MKSRILAAAAIAILNWGIGMTASAQDSDYLEEDGAYLENINGYNSAPN